MYKNLPAGTFGGEYLITYCNVNTNGTFSNCAATATSGEYMYPSYGIVIKNGVLELGSSGSVAVVQPCSLIFGTKKFAL